MTADLPPSGERQAEPSSNAGRLSGRSSAAPSPPVPGSQEWLDVVRSMVALLERSDARELSFTAGPLKVRLRRAPQEGIPQLVAFPPSPFHAAAPREAIALHDVYAPLTGIWYDAPTPGASPYVQVGSHVEMGTVIGLIETMKIFNEISSDAPGRVVQVHVRRADLVQANTPLISIDASEVATVWPHRG